MNDLEKYLLEGFRQFISIWILKTELDDNEDDQITVNNDDTEWKLVAAITPLLTLGSYEFYLDEEGVTKERVKIV
uniref:Uncharacterized protein n=1 Tax=Meloidogyne floridensis TaxID=298350 RepID=A0A915NSE3_9BILA